MLRRTFRVAAAMLLVTAALAAGQGRMAPCAECLTLVIEPGQAAAVTGPLNGTRIAVQVRAGSEGTAIAALSRIRDAGGTPGLVVTGIPPQPLAADAVRLAKDVFLDITAPATDTGLPLGETSFRLKSRFVELRGLSADVHLGLIATTAQHTALDREVTPYVDVMAEPATADSPRPDWPAAGSVYASIPSPARSPRLLLSAPQDNLETEVLVQDLATAMPLLVAALIPGGSATVHCGGQPLVTYLNPDTLDTVAVARGCAGATLEVAPPTARGDRIGTVARCHPRARSRGGRAVCR